MRAKPLPRKIPKVTLATCLARMESIEMKIRLIDARIDDLIQLFARERKDDGRK